MRTLPSPTNAPFLVTLPPGFLAMAVCLPVRPGLAAPRSVLVVSVGLRFCFLLVVLAPALRWVTQVWSAFESIGALRSHCLPKEHRSVFLELNLRSRVLEAAAFAPEAIAEVTFRAEGYQLRANLLVDSLKVVRVVHVLDVGEFVAHDVHDEVVRRAEEPGERQLGAA